MNEEKRERKERKEEWMTDNIGAEGTKALSEMLKVNTTLTSLNLESGDEERNGYRKKRE